MKSLFQQMIEDNSNVLIEQAIVIFQKITFQIKKEKKYRYIKLFAVLSKTKHETLN